MNNRGHQPTAFFECDFHVLSPKTSNLKTKNPLGLLRQRADEYVFSWIVTYNSTDAACGRDDDDADAPGDDSKRSFAEPESKHATPSSSIFPGRQKTDMTNASFGCLTRFDFPSLLRYFYFVLGRGADPISSRACFSDQLRTPARKGNCSRSAEVAAAAEAVCGWGPGLRPVHCHP